MNNKNKLFFTGLLSLLSANALLTTTLLTAALLTSTVHADSQDSAKGYLTDSSGEIWRDSSGDCWHGSDWTEADAVVVGCDGVTIDTSAEVIRGKGSGVIAQIAIPAGAVFGFNETELNDNSKAVIDEYRTQLGPELTDAYMVLVVGHTDSSGNASANKKVSLARAQSVANYLVENGVREEAIRVIGRGAEEPLVSNKTLEGRKENRRVDIFVVAEVRALDTIIFPSAVLFERRNGELSAAGLVALEKNRKEINKLLSDAAFIEIIGHTDDVGDDDYNMALSLKRADSVRDYLVGKGLDSSKVITGGMGETSPIANNSTEEGRAENRRVEILILGRLKE
jgi:OOP family OmpA-OmpF porin